jgi:uncharacterized protein
MQNISIIEFSVENFKIFKEKVTFSMLTKKNSHSFARGGKNLLRTSLIYGPNASGKSTLLQALTILRSGVIYSTNAKEGSDLQYHPFKLSQNKNKPIFFEIVFSLSKNLFRYNFSIQKNEIITENLFKILSTGKEEKYLVRKKQNIKLFNVFNNKNNEDIKEHKTRKEVLFISAASQWKDELSMQIVEGFKDINVISGPDSGNYRAYTIRLFKEDPGMKKRILDLLKKADFCIDDGEAGKIELPETIREQLASLTQEIPKEVDTIDFLHGKYDAKGNKIGVEKFNMSEESAGTQKFFDVLGPIVETLEKGRVLLIDEFDNSLHPLLTKLIIDLFEKNNPKNAQLIVTTHDTSLLSYKNAFIKDQFWFTEKDQFGAGSLFSLAEFDSELRNDTEYSRKYLEGRFGALPFIEST